MTKLPLFWKRGNDPHSDVTLANAGRNFAEGGFVLSRRS